MSAETLCGCRECEIRGICVCETAHDSRPKARVAYQRIDNGKIETSVLPVEQFTKLGCGCTRVEMKRPGGGYLHALTGCRVAPHESGAELIYQENGNR